MTAAGFADATPTSQAKIWRKNPAQDQAPVVIGCTAGSAIEEKNAAVDDGLWVPACTAGRRGAAHSFEEEILMRWQSVGDGKDEIAGACRVWNSARPCSAARGLRQH
ncbi:MAG: hypothetical protein ACRETM_10635 [Stenotrophobium sp.]